MASDNLMAIEQPWQFRSTFSDPKWVSDIFTKSLSGTTTPSNDDVFPVDLLESLLVQTPTVSGASENEFPAQKKRRSLPVSGRVTKRKSRASKRATTTFITTDPANFRQMVQQVTGVRLTSEVPVLKPEAQQMQPGFGGTTSFLLDSSFFMNGSVQPSVTAVGDGGAAGGFGFDAFCSFPTLESWKV